MSVALSYKFGDDERDAGDEALDALSVIVFAVAFMSVAGALAQAVEVAVVVAVAVAVAVQWRLTPTFA